MVLTMVHQFPLRTYVADIFIWRQVQLICPFPFEIQREKRHTNRGSQPFSAYSYFFDFSLYYILNVLYVQEVVTLQKKCLIYFHQKMRFTPVVFLHIVYSIQ